MGILDNTFALIKEATVFHRIHGNNESRKKRNYQTSVSGVENEIRIASQLLLRLENAGNNSQRNQYIKQEKLIRHKKRGNELRKEYFKTKKMRIMLKIILQYQDIYRRKRQVVGDILLANGLRM